MTHHKNRGTMPFRHHIVDKIPSDARGVYGFWYRPNGKCLYIGQAKGQPIKSRLKQHWNRQENPKLHLWMKAFGQQIEICYLLADDAKIDKLEKRLIKAFRPETNRTHRS